MVIAAAMKPVVSVCIANYNGIPIISSCLASVFAQLGDIPIEIIVHDDASTDDSVEYLRKNYGNINLIASENNVGFCIANNRMAAQAKGDYLLLLNNDAALFPDAISSLLAKAKEINAPAILGLPQYNADNGDLLDMGSMLDPFLNPIPNLNPEQSEIGMIMGSCLWIPKKLWKELGEFPEWFGSIGEDLYLCCLARLWGYSVHVIEVSGYRHHVGRSFGGGKIANYRLSTTYRRRALSEKNKTFVMLLCYPASLLVLLPLHFLFLAIEGLMLSFLNWSWRPLTDIYLPVISTCWRERRRLYQLRTKLHTSSSVHMKKFIAPFQWYPYKLVMLIKHKLPTIT